MGVRFKGYRQGQSGGACLVTVKDEYGDESVLAMPRLSRRESRHSPDGFQFGYSGSGPTELARAILVHLYPKDDRVRHPRCYRSFRDTFLSGIKADCFTLEEEVVRGWYEGIWMSANNQSAWPIEAGWLAQ